MTVASTIEVRMATIAGRAFRYGREEFAVLMSRADDEVLAAAREIADAIRSTTIVLGQSEVASVTVSIGVASVEKVDVNLSTLLHQDDLDLYEAKRNGRDCIRRIDPVDGPSLDVAMTVLDEADARQST